MRDKKRPDIEFVTNTGLRVVLKFEKNEYRAYSYDPVNNTMNCMMLGSLNYDPLIDYIKKHY